MKRNLAQCRDKQVEENQGLHLVIDNMFLSQFDSGMLGVEEYAVIYPPNGIIPFHGFSMYGKTNIFSFLLTASSFELRYRKGVNGTARGKQCSLAMCLAAQFHKSCKQMLSAY